MLLLGGYCPVSSGTEQSKQDGVGKESGVLLLHAQILHPLLFFSKISVLGNKGKNYTVQEHRDQAR